MAGNWEGTVVPSAGVGGEACEMRVMTPRAAGGFASVDVRCGGESAWRELYQEALMVWSCRLTPGLNS